MSRTANTSVEPESYRLREQVSLTNEVLLSRKPLKASRLNPAAVDLIGELDDDQYRSPERVAAATDHDPEAVSEILGSLHKRGFLEWRPARDPTYTPPVSIVVTVRDDRRNLEACLDALGGLQYPTYEVIVVDDGSSDGTTALLGEHPLADREMLQVQRVGSEWDPLGIGASRNRGVGSATYDIIAFTDADCRPSPSWLNDLVPYLAESDVVGGRVRPVGGTARSHYEGIASSLDMGDRPSLVDPRGNTPYLATANMVGRRDVFESVPFPDRDVAEDVDVSWRAIDAGFDVLYTPSGLVEHAFDDGVFDMIDTRIRYGSSEGLLARTHGRNGYPAVSVPGEALLLALSVPVAIVSAGVLWILAMLMASVATLAFVLRIQRSIKRYRVVRAFVTPTAVFQSWGRSWLSIGYDIGREVTRYYLLPLGLIAASALVVWPGPVTGSLWVGLLCVFGLPIVVEYSLQKPNTSPLAYAMYYTVDHLSYQYGTYKGAIRHRTIAHLDPRSRFRLTGVFRTASSGEHRSSRSTTVSRTSR